MWKRFWTVALAMLFVISLASVVDAQMRRPNDRRSPNANNNNNGNQGENPGNQGENPGNQGENPGNQGEDPGNDPSGGTPDGETPAEEDVCDELKYNATKGLYGLCVAFCEAQDSDCVPDYGTENPYANCRMRDRRILDNYNRKKKDGDPDMPCLPSAGEDPEFACPCWGQEDLGFFPFLTSSLSSYASDEQYGYCGLDDDYSNTDEDDEGNPIVLCKQFASNINQETVLVDGSSFIFDLFVSAGECDGYYCYSSIGCRGTDCDPELPASADFGLDEITEEEYANCRASIEQLMTYCN